MEWKQMTRPRYNFSQETIEALKHRSGFRCSFPGCTQITTGPSHESDTSFSNSGTACHIVAAAGGSRARRVDSNIDPDVCKAIDNGIWMCGTHGRLIDTDESRFSVEMLKKWRKLSETRAKLSQEQGRQIELSPTDSLSEAFVNETITVTQLGNESQLIGDALQDTCVETIWGAQAASCVRDLAIEMARNAFEHGHAGEFTMEVVERKIKLRDNGQGFDMRGLPFHENPRGGARALSFLNDEYRDKVIITYARRGQWNEVVVALIHTIPDVHGATQCTIKVTRDGVSNYDTAHLLQSPSLVPCDIVYLVLSGYFSPSDGFAIIQVVKPLEEMGKQVAFVVGQSLSVSVERLLKELYPKSSIIHVTGM